MPHKYIAGYLDADGSIQLIFRIRRGHQFRVRTFVRFYGTHEKTLRWIGKHLYKEPQIREPSGLMKTALWVITFSDREEVRNVLEELMPYLITKKQHAKIVLEALDILEIGKHDGKYPQRLRELMIEISKLQVKGGAKHRKNVMAPEYDGYFDTNVFIDNLK